MFEKDGKRFKNGWFEFTKQPDGSIWIHFGPNGSGHKFNRQKMEEFKEWLGEATKKRYEVRTNYGVVNEVLSTIIYDNELEETAIVFHPLEGLDCVSKAKELCRQMNEG